MAETGQKFEIHLHPPREQGVGSFDGGRITEIKPIGFPGEGSKVERVGPLFYWAWASSTGDGLIAMHPHQAFEIISYVIQGEIGHRDSLGTHSRVVTGGAQVMQTGSGVSHEEEILGDQTEFFQIWFEPYLKDALKRTPLYRDFHHPDLPSKTANGITVKAVLGNSAPMSLVADASLEDVTIDQGCRYDRALGEGRSLAVVTISGQGFWNAGEQGEKYAVKAKDFVVIHAQEDVELSATAEGNEMLRLAIVEVPTEVGYPLYPK